MPGCLEGAVTSPLPQPQDTHIINVDVLVHIHHKLPLRVHLEGSSFHAELFL